MRQLRIGIGFMSVLAIAACSEPTRRPPPSATTGVAGMAGPPPTGVGGAAADPGIIFPPPFETFPAADGGAATAACTPEGKPAPTPAGIGMGIPPMLSPTVTTAAKPVPAITGGTLLALEDGKTAVAADPDRDRVYVVDLTTDTVRSTIMLQEGDEPGRVVEDGAHRVHVALRRGGAVVTIDPTAGTLVGRRAVCSAPRGLAYQPAGDLVHVACAGGELVSLPAAAGAATRALKLENDLRDVVVSGAGSLLVSTFRRAEVLVVGADGKVGKRLRPALGNGPSPVTGMPRHTSPSVAWRMLPMGDAKGSVVMLHQMGVDDEINPSAGGYAGIKGCSAIVEAGVTVIAPDGATPAPATSYEMVSLAVDVALSPDKTLMALAVPGNGATSFPSVVSGSVNTMGNSPCSFLPTAMATMPKGEVVAVAYASNTALLAQMREPALLMRGDTGAQISLSTESRADSGHEIFHVNAGGGLACASCHPEGGEDGRVWKFACLGDRRTQSIRGRISGTAPFHWDGDETSFSKLMDDVFVGRMAGPQLSPAQKDALSGWVDTIPALPSVAGLDAAAVARGKAVFEDTKVACATCHAGALLTNNTTVDVGTGHALQVPSLRGVAWRAPFMHDGCASTLADRFGATCGGGDRHGATSTLSAAQLADLSTYLQSL